MTDGVAARESFVATREVGDPVRECASRCHSTGGVASALAGIEELAEPYQPLGANRVAPSALKCDDCD
jgi:hypothetical protein